MIPDNITKEHLEKAIEEIDRDGVRKGRHSSTYDLLHNGKSYPPKLVISIANKYANGSELNPNDFGGGKDTKAFELLQKEGFSIKEKPKTANPIYTLLMKVKADVEKAGFNYKSLRQNSRYVWVEDSNNTIGRKPAHYEFISRRNTLYLELHFEETKSKSLFQQLIKNLPEQLEWFDWNGSQSIRHKNSYSLYDQDIDSKIVNDLIEFDSLIGNKVRSILMNESKQYWLYSPGENAYLWDEFYQGGILGLGWDEIGDLSQYKSRDEIKKALVDAYGGTGSKKNDVSANDDFLNKIKIGDVIIAKKGRGELLGYGVVISDYIFDKNRKNYQKTRKIDWKIKGNWNVDFSLVLKTLTDISKYSSDLKEYNTYYERLLGIMGQIDKNVKTADMNFPLNTILYGPPGTGKTYNTILRAAQIIENRAIDSYDEALEVFKANLHDKIEFITFHQNYSYEDFIQGLRPETKEENDQLKFRKSDGVFKVIADRALSNIKESEKAPEELSQVNAFSEALEILKDKILESDEPIKINETAYFTAVEDDAFRYSGDNWTLNDKGFNGFRMKYSDLARFFEEGVKERREIKNLENISGLAKQHATYFIKAFELVRSLMPKSITKTQKTDKKNYVIIIDEINRANISRVFGELITLIEPDKRSHGTIPLEARLPSGDPFIVPSNLFIIGTMNTADKSIALLDIALRRRFEFESMYPKYEIKNQEIYDVEILEKINKQIIKSKGHDFQIGHAYFMGDNKDLVQRMNKKVIPLLLEYYMNDEKEVKGILNSAGLIIEENSWPLKISGKND